MRPLNEWSSSNLPQGSPQRRNFKPNEKLPASKLSSRNDSMISMWRSQTLLNLSRKYKSILEFFQARKFTVKTSENHRQASQQAFIRHLWCSIWGIRPLRVSQPIFRWWVKERITNQHKTYLSNPPIRIRSHTRTEHTEIPAARSSWSLLERTSSLLENVFSSPSSSPKIILPKRTKSKARPPRWR